MIYLRKALLKQSLVNTWNHKANSIKDIFLISLMKSWFSFWSEKTILVPRKTLQSSRDANWNQILCLMLTVPCNIESWDETSAFYLRLKSQASLKYNGEAKILFTTFLFHSISLHSWLSTYAYSAEFSSTYFYIRHGNSEKFTLGLH